MPRRKGAGSPRTRPRVVHSAHPASGVYHRGRACLVSCVASPRSMPCDYRVKPANDEMEIRSRGAFASELCRTTKPTTKPVFLNSVSLLIKRGEWSADRRIQPMAASGGCGGAPPFSASEIGSGRPPVGAPRRRLPRRPNAGTQPRPRFTRARGRGCYPRRHTRLSGAPRAPVVMPAGTMPGPPGSGVTSPARRNRTRSINRLSPVTSPR
jgi:hypothetical protein